MFLLSRLFYIFCIVFFCFFFFFKQKTAYEMRISDWSSDVCSSDLLDRKTQGNPTMETLTALKIAHVVATVLLLAGALGLAIWVWRTRRNGDEIGRASCRERVCQYV